MQRMEGVKQNTRTYLECQCQRLVQHEAPAVARAVGKPEEAHATGHACGDSIIPTWFRRKSCLCRQPSSLNGRRPLLGGCKLRALCPLLFLRFNLRWEGYCSQV
jgi:hypothetical protein